jgi:transcriptional regulator with XRE-family HTH domain
MAKRQPSEFLTDTQVADVVRGMLDLFGPAVSRALMVAGIDPREQVRWQIVAARCRQEREKRGFTIREVAKAMAVPQYRVKDIEESQVGSIELAVLTRYLDFLGLGTWIEGWQRANPQLAARLGFLPSASPRTHRPRSSRVADYDAVLRFEIVLDEIEPRVWRRIEVPATYTFWDLHVAIQDAMGWQDSHLHEFRILEPGGVLVRIGIPDDEFPDERPTRVGWTTPLASYLGAERAIWEYLYDFGDSWEHRVTFEGRFPRIATVSYPRCVDGARACPPEDVGGPSGYAEFVHAVTDPHHEQHDDMLRWAGGSFDPAAFVPDEVRFDDPRQRWRVAFRDS